MRERGGSSSTISTDVMLPPWRAITPVSSCSTPSPERATISTPIFSGMLTCNSLVLPKQLVPVALRFEEHLDHLAHRSVAPCPGDNHLHATRDLVARIRGRDSKPHAVHHHNVGKVVA